MTSVSMHRLHPTILAAAWRQPHGTQSGPQCLRRCYAIITKPACDSSSRQSAQSASPIGGPTRHG